MGGRTAEKPPIHPILFNVQRRHWDSPEERGKTMHNRTKARDQEFQPFQLIKSRTVSEIKSDRTACAYFK